MNLSAPWRNHFILGASEWPPSCRPLAGSNSAKPQPAPMSCHWLGGSPSSFICGNWNGVALHRLPGRVLVENVFQRRVLLDQHHLPCPVDLFELLGRGS